jgi:RNA polymerase sigma-70 factor, ECF subfamily
MSASAKPEGESQPLQEIYGLVSRLLHGQSVVPRVAEAEEKLVSAVLHGPGELESSEKESVFSTIIDVWKNGYGKPFHLRTPHSSDSALAEFAFKLVRYGPLFALKDIEDLRNTGFSDKAILEAVINTALGQMICVSMVAVGLEFGGVSKPAFADRARKSDPILRWSQGPGGPYLTQSDVQNDHPAYTGLREQYGFVPNLFRAISLESGPPQAILGALELVLFPEEHLSRVQKESILLVISAANLNTYWVALQSQVLAILGVPLADVDQMIEDVEGSSIPSCDIALLAQARRLTLSASSKFDMEALRQQGFSGPQIVEAVATAALGNFLNTLQFGLGAVPDFAPQRTFTEKDLYRWAGMSRPTADSTGLPDPDAELVAKVKAGEADAFEELVRRHVRRIFGTLLGIVGNSDDAQDAMQDVFLKAFENVERFEGRSKFSTWLTSIAVNTGTEMLRQRKPVESLEVEDEEAFRPRQLQSWEENPEQLLAASQTNDLVQREILRLPQKYRVAVLLRDISQLSTEEAAVALELSVPALKARVLRGRLMLRESLAPYFIRAEKLTSDA